MENWPIYLKNLTLDPMSHNTRDENNIARYDMISLDMVSCYRLGLSVYQ